MTEPRRARRTPRAHRGHKGSQPRRRRRTPAAARPSVWRRVAFLLGVALIYVVLQTRFDYWAQHMFFLNSIQHVVMHHIGPFLIALGAAGETLKRGMPRRVCRAVASPVAGAVVRTLQHPVLAVLLYGFYLTRSRGGLLALLAGSTLAARASAQEQPGAGPVPPFNNATAAAWKKAIEEYGPGVNRTRERHLKQIVGNWGRFEPGQTQPAGTQASVDFRFRNGKKVSFVARAINVPQLLEDVKDYFRGHQGQLDYRRMNISDLGFHIITRGENQYLGEQAAAWDLDLKPLPDHVDDRVTVTTPMKKPGAYLVTAQMSDGNTSRIIVWVSDTVLVKKPLDGKVFCFVGDAVNGKPVPNADVEFFGWKQIQGGANRNDWRTVTTAFTAATGAGKNCGRTSLPRPCPTNSSCPWIQRWRSSPSTIRSRLASSSYAILPG